MGKMDDMLAGQEKSFTTTIVLFIRINVYLVMSAGWQYITQTDGKLNKAAEENKRNKEGEYYIRFDNIALLFAS
jgi:hypothetical protein